MSWVEKSLGEVLKLEYGKPLDKSLRKEGGKYPAYGANGIKAWSDEYFHDEETIVVGRKGSAGELTLTDGKFWPLDVTYFVKTNKNDYDIKFLYYLLLSLDLPSLATGVKPGINRNNVYKIQAKFPSYSTQKQVAGQLDKAFADIEQARANTEKNLQNARELFDSYLQQVFSERGDGWEELALQNAVSDDCSLSYGVVQPGEEFDGGIPVVRPVDLKKKSVEKSGLKRMDPKLADSYQRTSLSGSELLLCVRGETGTVAVSDPSLFGANVTRGIVPIKFSEEKVSLDFAYFQFLSPLINRQIKEKTYGTALKQINIRDLRQLSFFIPPIDKQYVIAEKLSEFQRAINKLESVYKSKLDALDELKQSLLQQAFTGQLTQG
ncbi:hypothetical protein FMH16_21220 [Vibrio vulnificus]|nr:hypothetical protein [Vibrio vulnificus]